jgi:hypothetical protein
MFTIPVNHMHSVHGFDMYYKFGLKGIVLVSLEGVIPHMFFHLRNPCMDISKIKFVQLSQRNSSVTLTNIRNDIWRDERNAGCFLGSDDNDKIEDQNDITLCGHLNW